MKKKTLPRLLLEFVAITAPVTWWWMHGGQQAYWQLYRKLATPILVAMGVTSFPPGLVRDRTLNFLPFVALMLITPGLSRLRRWGGMAAGLVVIFAGQVLLAWWAFVTHVQDGRDRESMSDFFPALILSDALPFVLWALLANRILLDLLARILPAATGATAAGGQTASAEPAAEDRAPADPAVPAAPGDPDESAR